MSTIQLVKTLKEAKYSFDHDDQRPADDSRPELVTTRNAAA